ncbi:probable nucleoredoxin 1 [Syzygium oleosum]|uniref:probable nucleoredoxin 1 n=1 Tax=Syzygium oleosum TaxID=219896 RepID=UPI0024B8EA83|nr:probable nucleoredoxin 1 [Syzygium oleosum]
MPEGGNWVPSDAWGCNTVPQMSLRCRGRCEMPEGVTGFPRLLGGVTRFPRCPRDAVMGARCPGGDLEIIFISADEDEEAFSGYFSKMPWLAIPYSDSEKRDSLDELFEVRGIPHLVILDGTGTLSTDRGVEIVREYGVGGHPFTPERIKELKEQEEAAKRNQSLTSLLVRESRDFVVSSDGKKVPVTELEGKTVGLYFSLSMYKSCVDFTPMLVEVHEKLKVKGESFEIVQIPVILRESLMDWTLEVSGSSTSKCPPPPHVVRSVPAVTLVEVYNELSRKGDLEIIFISANEDEEAFSGYFSKMPWLAIPYSDSEKRDSLDELFEVRGIPHLVILDGTGTVSTDRGVEIVREYGVGGHPFTPERIKELKEQEEAAKRNQSLTSLLVRESRDFVVSSDGKKVPVTELEGQTVGLYFSLSMYKSCVDFTPMLVEVHEKLKVKRESFEIVQIPGLRGRQLRIDCSLGIPTIALPFGHLQNCFFSDIEGIIDGLDS